MKSKFKKIFEDKEMTHKYFTSRPLDKEYVEYSASDVRDLNQLAEILEQKMENEFGANKDKIIRDVSESYRVKGCQKFIRNS